ncbi:hypothetical protein OEZ86_012518 [Tetradesmus obliquus]|nr:hypothetical protein OEZ86_012518 [Tetradesmus obliquus]
MGGLAAAAAAAAAAQEDGQGLLVLYLQSAGKDGRAGRFSKLLTKNVPGWSRHGLPNDGMLLLQPAPAAAKHPVKEFVSGGDDSATRKALRTLARIRDSENAVALFRGRVESSWGIQEWQPQDCSQAARLVYLSQGVSQSVLRDAYSLAHRLVQQVGMVRLAMAPDNPAAAAAAAAGDAAAHSRSASSKGSTMRAKQQQQQQQQQQLQCYLLPWELPRYEQLSHLALDLRRAVKQAADARLSSYEVRSLVEMFRLCKLPEQQPRWQQQRRQQGELLLRDISVTQLDNKNQPDQVIKDAEEVLREVLSAGYPPLFMKSYVMKDGRMLHHSVVITRDASQQPDYRPDLDPAKPWDLSFALPQPARELLQQQLPLLKQQQQLLQRQAAAQGLLLQGGGMAAGSSSSSSDAVVADEAAQEMEREKKRRPGMSHQAARELQQHLERTAAKNAASSSHAQLQAQREALPAAAARGDCLRLLEQHQVVIVTGETGCGKSTQVPQFILEQAQQQGTLRDVNIVAAQPRRLITTSLSKRVAEERGEAVGQVVGYSIHGDRRTSRTTRLTFCTTGILIRRLMVDPVLSNVSHVVIDEVHERGVEVDFLLAAMRQLAAARPDLKLLLMSATLNSANIQDYFAAHIPGTVGCLHIPGRTYTVEQFYLEDLIEARLRTALTAKAAAAAAAAAAQDSGQRDAQSPLYIDAYSSNYDASSFAAYLRSCSSSGGVLGASAAAGRVAAGQGEAMPLSARVAVGRHDVKNARAEPTLRDYDIHLKGYVPAEDEHLKENYSPATVAEVYRWAGCIVKPRNNEALRWQHSAAAAAAIQFICRHETDPGSVLVFLPNWQAIADVYEALLRDDGLAAGLQLFVLHSLLPMAEQQEAFAHAQPGFRKVILATNIAESSITFDDVAAVVDSCRVNLADFDAANNLPTLGPQWASQASLWQRRGRAGRVRPGMAIHLIPRSMAEQHLEPYDPPELQRMPLGSVCLLVKSLGFDDIKGFLAGVPDPPAAAAVAAAVGDLQALWALDEQQGLTPLGRLLALLPGDLRLTRMVIFGALLGVLDQVLTLAAAETAGDVLRLPNEAMVADHEARKGGNSSSSSSAGGDGGKQWIRSARDLQWERRAELAAGSSSDHAAVLAAFKEFTRIDTAPIMSYQKHRRMWQSMLSDRTLAEVRRERLNYTQLLYRAGFLQLAPGSAWDSSSSSPQPWWAGGSSSSSGQQQQQSYDALFDADVDELLGLADPQQQQQQQQQMPTAMDWALGEYADAAQGLHTFATLDDDDLSGGGSSSLNLGSSSKIAASGARAAAGASRELGARDLRQLIRQYSWNADKPEMLQAALAAGLYPNIAYVKPSSKQEKAATKAAAASAQGSRDLKASEKALHPRSLSWTSPQDGSVFPHPGSVLGQAPPQHRWAAYGSKRLSTANQMLFLSSISPVPDLALLLFATDLEHTPLPDAAAAAAAAAAGGGSRSASDAAAEAVVGAAGAAAEQEGSSSAADDNAAADADGREEEEQEQQPHGQDINDIWFRVANATAEIAASINAELNHTQPKPAEAVLLGGYARYKMQQPADLAALLQLREHMQLLLQMKVAGLSVEAFAASKDFSGLLGQLMLAEAAPSDSTLAWLQQQYWAQCAARKEKEEKKAAARADGS